MTPATSDPLAHRIGLAIMVCATYLHEPYRLEFDRHERLTSGVRIPLRASGTFETADGDWLYWRFEVIDEAWIGDSSRDRRG